MADTTPILARYIKGYRAGEFRSKISLLVLQLSQPK